VGIALRAEYIALPSRAVNLYETNGDGSEGCYFGIDGIESD
jgi:hypothetical protein